MGDVVASTDATLDLGELGLDAGGYLLIKRSLGRLPVGARLAVRGLSPELPVHLKTWCRQQGHEVVWPAGDAAGVVTRGGFDVGRWRGAEWAGEAGAIVDSAPARWGLAARGARVEAGGPVFDFTLTERATVWSDDAARLYAQAAAAQWDPNTAVDWNAEFDLPEEVEDAVVQVMTYLIENETAALVIPARFAAQMHPHFREIIQLLAIQAADEARHIEVFTRRARLRREHLGLSTVGGQTSLKTLIDEPDFALASFLLSVLGEGSFLSLLWFLHENAPDPVTAQITRLSAQDEARHVVFGLSHLERHVREDPPFLEELATAVERRHSTLEYSAGLNEEVFDALVVLAAGSWEPAAVRSGFDRVGLLKQEMDAGRRRRLVRLGFDESRAAALSALHTRNFM